MADEYDPTEEDAEYERLKKRDAEQAELARRGAAADGLLADMKRLTNHYMHGHDWSGETRWDTIQAVERFAEEAVARFEAAIAQFEATAAAQDKPNG